MINMSINPNPNSSSSSTTATACGKCGIEERQLLLNIPQQKIFHRLCTSCVLRLHPHCFCPTCFVVYEGSYPNNGVICSKCYSCSHSHCVGPNVLDPYICPICINPNSPILKLTIAIDLNAENSEGVAENGSSGENRIIDNKNAKILLAAAKISKALMSKAVTVARSEAERAAAEIVYRRKQAKEALEHLANLVAKEKQKNKEAVVFAAASAEASGSLGHGHAYGSRRGRQRGRGSSVDSIYGRTDRANLVANEKRKNKEAVVSTAASAEAFGSIGHGHAHGSRRGRGRGRGGSVNCACENTDRANNLGGDINGEGGNQNSDGGVGVIDKESEWASKFGSAHESSVVLAALNLVELKGGRRPEIWVENSLLAAPSNDIVPMDVEENVGLKVNHVGKS